MSRGSFYWLRVDGDLSQQDVANICGVNIRTVSNWDTSDGPIMAQKLIGLFSGKMDFLGNHWAGFVFKNGVIGEDFSKTFIYPGEIRGISYLYQAAKIHKVCKVLDVNKELYFDNFYKMSQ